MYDILPIQEPTADKYDAIILAVGHDQFRDMGAAGIRKLGRDNSILFDVKYALPKNEVDGRL